MIVFIFLVNSKSISVEPSVVNIWQEDRKIYIIPTKEKSVSRNKMRITKYPDTMKINIMLPPKSYAIFKVDYNNKTVQDSITVDYGLAALAQEIINTAPQWLKADLLENLRKMDLTTQVKYAQMIIDNENTAILDELYFQIAHISPTLALYIPSELLIKNAEFIYKIDEELSYVDVVDYGDPSMDENYYSTTKYRIVNTNGDTIWIEIPMEIYYWWIVMPKGTDEIPTMGENVYYKFWRDYLYYGDQTFDYTDGGKYPLLKDYLTKVKILWNGEKYVLDGNRTHSDTMSFVNALGLWIAEILPEKASGNRPIQPNVIAYEHNGNCGEIQDLIWASGRTGLVPFLGTLDINEDHVWCEIYWPMDSSWYPFQVDWAHGATHIADSSIGYDKDRGGGKYISCVWNWRGDGYQYSFVEPFSKTCTLTVNIIDKDGLPYAGFNVNISSEGWQTTNKWRGFAGVTDRNGRFTTLLGEEQNYYITMIGQVIDSAQATAGSHFTVEHQLTYSDEYGIVNDAPMEKGPGTGWYIYTSIKIPYEIIHGYSYTYESMNQTFALKQFPGVLGEFYITTRDQIEKIGTIQQLKYYDKKENISELEETFFISNPEDLFLILYNPHPKVSIVIKGEIGITDKQGINNITRRRISNKRCFVEDFKPPYKGIIEVFNSTGKLILKTKTEIFKTQELSPGIYFVKTTGKKGGITINKVIKVK